MSIEELVANQQAMQQENVELRKQERVKTRTGRFRERWEHTFDVSIEDIGVEVLAEGDESPSEAWGMFTYQGKNHRIEFKRDQGGIGVYLDDTERLCSVTGGNHMGNTQALINQFNKPTETV